MGVIKNCPNIYIFCMGLYCLNIYIEEAFIDHSSVMNYRGSVRVFIYVLFTPAMFHCGNTAGVKITKSQYKIYYIPIYIYI